MSLISALLLGVVQGITEFLPVSSSGHLAIARNLLDLPVEGTDGTFLMCCCTWVHWWLYSWPTGRISGI